MLGLAYLRLGMLRDAEKHLLATAPTVLACHLLAKVVYVPS